jgi:hypothetical protein
VSRQSNGGDAGSRLFALLRLASVALLVPLHEVQSLESVEDIDKSRRVGGSAGALRRADSWVTVFCLSDNLEPQPELPAAFRMCAILATGGTLVGLACHAVSSVDDAALIHHPLPTCMRATHSPIRGLAKQGERVYCRTTAADLVPFLEEAP